MNRVKIKYLKLMAIAAILATSVIPSTHTSIAKNQPSPVNTEVPGADLASEERVPARRRRFECSLNESAAHYGRVPVQLAAPDQASNEVSGR